MSTKRFISNGWHPFGNEPATPMHRHNLSSYSRKIQLKQMDALTMESTLATSAMLQRGICLNAKSSNASIARDTATQQASAPGRRHVATVEKTTKPGNAKAKKHTACSAKDPILHGTTNVRSGKGKTCDSKPCGMSSHTGSQNDAV